MASNIKTTIEIDPGMASRVIEWLNAGRDASMMRSMPRSEVALLRRGDLLIMGVGLDDDERIFAPGTSAIFWLLERLGPPTGWAVTLVIGGEFDDEAAIVNCFYESDPAGFPFRRAEDNG